MKKVSEYWSKVVKRKKSIFAGSVNPNYNSAATSPALIINDDSDEKKSYVSDVELKSDLESNQSVPASVVAREENNSDEAVHEDLTGYSEIAAAEIPANEENNTAAIISRRLHYYFDSFDQEKRKKLYEEVIGTLSSIPHHPRDFDFYRLAQRGIIQFLPQYPRTFSSKLGLHAAFAIDQLTWGVALAIQDIWPAIFTGLLAHDFIQYLSFPGERYGNTLWNIFLGNMIGQHLLGGTPNEHNWVNNFGNYVLSGDYSYWLYAALILSLPMLTASANYVLHLDFHYRSDPDFAVLEDQHLAAHNRLHEIFNFIYPMRRELTRAEFNLLWNGALAQYEAQTIMDNVVQQTDFAVLTRFQAMRVLANVANAYSEEQEHGKRALETLRKLAEGSSSETSEELRESAKAKSTRAVSVVTSLYANYLLWRIGKNDKRRFNWTFTPLSSAFSSYATYANLRLVDIVMQKMIDIVAYLLQRNRCEEAGKVCYYAKEIAAYVCQFCSWDFVDFKDRDSLQACFDGLLNHPDLTAESLLSYLREIAHHKNITSIDLSKQPHDKWTVAQFQEILTVAQNMVSSKGLDSFNMSMATPNSIPPGPERVGVLTDFLRAVPPEAIDLTNVNLGEGVVPVVESLIQGDRTKDLILDGNPLNTNGTAVVTRAMREMKVSTISSRDNELTDDAVAEVASALPGSAVQNLGLGGNNAFSDEGVLSIAGVVGDSAVTDLSLSDNPQGFTYESLGPLAQAVQTSDVESLSLGNTGMSDTEIAAMTPYMPGSKLKTLDVSRNTQMTDQSVELLFAQGFPNSTIETVNLSGNRITDDGLTAARQYLSQASVTSVDFSDMTTYTDAGVAAFIGNVSEMALTSVRFANANLDSNVACVVASEIAKPGNPLKSVDLSNNKITGDCARKLFVAATTSNLEALSVGNNPIVVSEDIKAALINLVSNGKLKRLDLSGVTSTDEAMLPVIDALKDSTLEELDLSYISIGDDVAEAIAEQIVTVSPPVPLADEKLSVDEIRWFDDHGEASSNLKFLKIVGTQITGGKDSALCRASLKATTVIYPDPCQSNQNNQNNFPASSSRTTPFFNSFSKTLVGMAGGAMTASTVGQESAHSAPLSSSNSEVNAANYAIDWKVWILVTGTSLLLLMLLAKLVVRAMRSEKNSEVTYPERKNDEEIERPEMRV